MIKRINPGIGITCIVSLLIVLLLIVLLNGCAVAYKSEEQEGGITGTGNSSNCEEPHNKKQKECNDKL